MLKDAALPAEVVILGGTDVIQNDPADLRADELLVSVLARQRLAHTQFAQMAPQKGALSK